MDAPISPEEVLDVIKNLKGGSAPASDGFSIPYYKTFAETLAPRLAKFFNSKHKGDPVDPHLNAAFISVIPKPETYRAISLINNDLKILTKILANRVESFINRYIHKDQKGFIPGRQGPDQVRRAIGIISILQSGWDRDLPRRVLCCRWTFRRPSTHSPGHIYLQSSSVGVSERTSWES